MSPDVSGKGLRAEATMIDKNYFFPFTDIPSVFICMFRRQIIETHSNGSIRLPVYI
jgi:hypothetical protein